MLKKFTSFSEGKVEQFEVQIEGIELSKGENTKTLRKSKSTEKMSFHPNNEEEQLFREETLINEKIVKLMLSRTDEGSKVSRDVVKDIHKFHRKWSVYGKDVPALVYAAGYSNKYVCRWLVRVGGANVAARCKKSGGTALHYAVWNSHSVEDTLRFLSSLDLDYYARDFCDKTALFYALEKPNMEAATILMEKMEFGAEDLIKSKEYDVKVFLEYCDPERIMNFVKDGKTLLHLAAEFGDVELCQWMVDEKGQNPHASNLKTLATVLHYAAKNKKNGHRIINYFGEQLKYLKDETNKFNKTPLHCALKKENLSAAQALINIGASLLIKRKEKSYLHYCLKRNKLKSAGFLLQCNNNLTDEIEDWNVMLASTFVSIHSGNKKMLNWWAYDKRVHELDCEAASASLLDLTFN
ncbi:Hypothetical predicted protein [Cloeon dipterum]|uniref:Uncharacterized protein n=1 Tax=Cloeon dipterum TaxID=197152 RepID=A0A8S1DWJ2_9INSE|nr:Hypothetical predicted protein [Cloeon dipterum]